MEQNTDAYKVALTFRRREAEQIRKITMDI